MNFKEHLLFISSQAKTFVPPEGNLSRPIMIIGEQPGRVEVFERAPFRGPAGKLLKSLLQAAGIALSSCYLTNTIKEFDQQLEGYITAPKTRLQSPQWSSRGTEYVNLLEKEISEANAEIIIPVGNVALSAVLKRWGINKWRGSIIPYENRWVCPILHPASVLHGQSENRFLILQDLKKMQTFIDGGKRLMERHIITKPSFPQILDFLELMYVKGMEGHPVSFDIEVKNLELNCISFSISADVAMSIPLVDARGDLWNPVEELQIMKGIAAILQSPTIRKLGQNLIFDTHFLLRKYGIRSQNLDDSMIAQHTLLPQIPKGLDMITSLWTDQQYYKDEGKEWMKGRGTYDKLWVYNGLDSAVVSEAFPKITKALIQMDNIQAYERQLSIVQPCCYMMERGIKVDIAKLEQARELMKAEAIAARKELAQIAPGLNPNSPKQMQEYFYGCLKLPPYKNKQHKISVDADALKRIARKGGQGTKEARLILTAKKKEKLVSTYLEHSKFDTDSRIRCSYNPVGTTFSRLSSSASIFGTGMNLQNWPHSMLRFLTPDEGYIAYTIDLSQAENRIVAYVGRIEKMINAFETGQDVHRLTASLIFNKPVEEISDEPGSCSLGNGESTERQWGKKANHGLNYDLGYKSFALYYDMSEKDAKFVVDRYHQAYPELRKNFHGYIKRCLKESRTVTNLMGRKTLFITDLSDSTFKEAYSCIPQGTVGDIINERGMAFLYYNKIFREVELLMQVHDSITFQIPISMGWHYHAYVLQAVKDSLEQPIKTHYGRQFIIPADTVMGLSLMKEEGYELKSKKWPESVQHLEQALKLGYEKLRDTQQSATN